MSEVENKTNPAERLRQILNSARVLPPQITGQWKICRNAWCEVFEIEDPHTEDALVQVMGRLTQMRMLFEELIENLEGIESLDDHLFIDPIKELSKSVNLNHLNSTWNNVTSLFSDRNMTSLDFVQNLIAQLPGLSETVLPEEELNSISKQSDELYDRISNSNLPKGVKAIFLDLIRELQNAVHEYRIRGAKRLKEAVAKVVGTVVVNPEVKEAIAHGSKDEEAIQAFANLVARIEKAYRFATQIKSLYEAVAVALPLLGAGAK